MMEKDLRVGDRVRLVNRVQRETPRRESCGTARIERFYADIPGGLQLDKPLAGFRSWNEMDVQRVGRASEDNTADRVEEGMMNDAPEPRLRLAEKLNIPRAKRARDFVEAEWKVVLSKAELHALLMRFCEAEDELTPDSV